MLLSMKKGNEDSNSPLLSMLESIVELVSYYLSGCSVVEQLPSPAKTVMLLKGVTLETKTVQRSDHHRFDLYMYLIEK